MILQYDGFWTTKADQKSFEYDSGKYIVTFGFVEGSHDAVYIRIYEWYEFEHTAEYMFQGGYWIEDGWTENLWMAFPDDMIKQIELLAARYYKLKAFA